MNIFKKLQIASLKVLLNTVGQLSDGISLATREGFTSGKMLDYIYKNKPQGKLFIGKLMDKMYLEHPGWQDIRVRKNNLVENIDKAVRLTLESKQEAKICDVASGPALYILEILEKYKSQPVCAEIRDLDERWIKEAYAKAQESNLKLEYKVANALEPADFMFERKPDIFVASGFYDWFSDDELVKKSMKLIYDALPQGGYFAFTNQAGHVDLTMTNAVFKDFNNQQLNMTTRGADVINAMLKEIGFTVLDVKMDKYGHYLNILALK